MKQIQDGASFLCDCLWDTLKDDNALNAMQQRRFLKRVKVYEDTLKDGSSTQIHHVEQGSVSDCTVQQLCIRRELYHVAVTKG